MKKRFSCYIITETTLGIQCAKHIINSGTHLLGIVSPNNKIHQWAITNNITYYSSIKNFQLQNITPKSFDFLFSIVNYTKISEEILDLPFYYAVNYHDSILPKYAGVHATSWAILKSEPMHGVSWHIMNELIDSGIIVILLLDKCNICKLINKLIDSGIIVISLSDKFNSVISG